MGSQFNLKYLLKTCFYFLTFSSWFHQYQCSKPTYWFFGNRFWWHHIINITTTCVRLIGEFRCLSHSAFRCDLVFLTALSPAKQGSSVRETSVLSLDFQWPGALASHPDQWPWPCNESYWAKKAIGLGCYELWATVTIPTRKLGVL